MRRRASEPDRRVSEHPVLSFERAEPVRFTFEGRCLNGRNGETIAAALIANGIDVFRYSEKRGRPRGFYCAVGKCASCLMVVDGRPNVMVCVEPLREGISVARQRGRGRLR